MHIPRKHGGIKNGLHFALFLPVPEGDAYDSRSYKTFYQINHLYFSQDSPQGCKKTLLLWATHSHGIPVNWDFTANTQDDSEITIMSSDSLFPTLVSVLAPGQDNAS